ncbi:hypothetical protein L218DRAFT_880184, partial [Marasmius fiardii PR-910]
SSRDRVEDTYERQNDQRLDELHSKIRTLRGVSGSFIYVNGIRLADAGFFIHVRASRN